MPSKPLAMSVPDLSQSTSHHALLLSFDDNMVSHQAHSEMLFLLHTYCCALTNGDADRLAQYVRILRILSWLAFVHERRT
jgi:hypothetical protein